MKQKGVSWSTRESGETLLVQEPPKRENSGRKRLCICGKCQCRKHHCPIHHSATFNLLPCTSDRNEAMCSHYQRAFQLAGAAASKRGFTLPPQILPNIPREHMALTSVSHYEHQRLPLPTSAKNYKPEDKAFVSTEPIDSSTSYEVDFPRRPIEGHPPVATLMHTTIPKREEVTASAAFTTTNRRMLRKWSGKLARRVPFGEPPQKPFFTGDFYGSSVSKQDFSAEVANGRPSTTFKKATTMHESSDVFDNTTTNTSAYTLPIITKQVPPHLRSRSEKGNETLEKQVGKVQCITQYTLDNPGFETFPTRRPIIPPRPDNLKLFKGHLVSQSESQSNYIMSDKALRPRTSFKIAEKLHSEPDVQFSNLTSMGNDFKAVPTEEMVTELSEVDKRAAEFGHAQRNGIQVKLTHNFGGKFHDTTTNKSELFQFSRIKPRIRYGDQHEATYKPTTAKFNSLSENRVGFPPLKGKPSTSFKPLDLRFKKDKDPTGEKLASATAYRSDFPVREMAKTSVCPAELLLQS